MQTSIEFFLLANFLSDTMILFVISKCAGRSSLHRVMLSAGICALYSLLALWKPMPWGSPAVQLMLLIPLGMFLTGTVDIRIWGGCALGLSACAFITGGILSRFGGARTPRTAASLSTFAAVLVIYALYRQKRHAHDNWTIDLCITHNGASIRFPALIDTGNRLHEPISGLPVIIAEAEVIGEILPESGYRSVAFGGLGGNGTLLCFRPESIWRIEGRKLLPMPDAWVGICPTPLPGANRALAPGEFADR